MPKHIRDMTAQEVGEHLFPHRKRTRETLARAKSNAALADQLMAEYRTKAARLEQAAVAQSWRGSRPTEEWAQITKDLASARRELEVLFKSLIVNQQEPKE